MRNLSQVARTVTAVALGGLLSVTGLGFVAPTDSLAAERAEEAAEAETSQPSSPDGAEQGSPDGITSPGTSDPTGLDPSSHREDESSVVGRTDPQIASSAEPEQVALRTSQASPQMRSSGAGGPRGRTPARHLTANRGQNTHSVLTAHTGLSTATLFNDLKKVKLGDTFSIAVAGEVLTYQAIETQTILPDETGSLIIREGQDIVTLVTCTPLGINTHRYLVTGERVFSTPVGDVERAGRAPEVPRFPWWLVIQIGGVTVVGLLVWRSGLPKAKG